MFTRTILITALIGAIASPAFAATKKHSPAGAVASQAFAATKKHSPRAEWDVYVNGKYVGSDPDAFIRSQLMREIDTGDE